MGKGLFDYAAQQDERALQDRTAADQAQMEAVAAEITAREAAQAEAEALKDRISEQLAQGYDPEIILYAAVRCIGLLTGDDEWISKNEQQLEAVYGDLMQQSMERDNAAEARKRLEARTNSYNDRTRRQIRKQIDGCSKLLTALNKALIAIDSEYINED